MLIHLQVLDSPFPIHNHQFANFQTTNRTYNETKSPFFEIAFGHNPATEDLERYHWVHPDYASISRKSAPKRKQ